MSADVVWALAGRRIDEVGAPARFPLERVPLVGDKLRALLADHRVDRLVCSAACGADLLALQAARALGLRRTMVLPCPVERFRQISVVDRPGDWGPLYDDLVGDARRTDDLVVLADDPAAPGAYLRANEALLDHTLALAGALARAAAAIVWDGQPRGSDDVTHAFAGSARHRGLPVHEVLTS